MSNRQQVFVSALAALSLVAVGCSPTLQEGRFTCTRNDECPTGFVCRMSVGVCYLPGPGPDATIDAPVDAPSAPDASVDAPSVDAPSVDAPSGCGVNCIQLMVLNADPFMSGTIEFDNSAMVTQHIPIPAYGTTSAVIDVPNVPVGGVLHVIVPPTATIIHDLAIPTASRYLMVLGPSVSSSNVLLLESNPAPLHSLGYVYINLVDMTADETGGFIARGAGRDSAHAALPNAFDHTTNAEMLPFLPGSTGALRIELVSAPSSVLVAGLLADQIPASDGSYYVVLAGHVSAHLDSADGLRFIPGLPSATALRSSRLVRFLNTIGTNATVCDGATPLVTLAVGGLSEPTLPPTSSAWPLSIHTGSDCSTGFSHDVSVGVAVGRTLVSITGDIVSAPAWGAVAIAEPMPTVGLDTIVIHNGLPNTSDIAGVSNIPSLGTASTTVVSPPATIDATTPAGPQSFTWAPISRQSWAVITPSGASYSAWEVDSPFDAAWMVANKPAL